MNSNTDKPIRYLSASDIYQLNFEITDGDTLVRDLHLLNSAAQRPMITLFGEPQFPTLFDKAAALLHSIAYHHLFIDGNKRTAERAVTLFLEVNGYGVTWTHTECQAYMLEVAQGQHTIEEIAAWLTARTHRLAAD